MEVMKEGRRGGRELRDGVWGRGREKELCGASESEGCVLERNVILHH